MDTCNFPGNHTDDFQLRQKSILIDAGSDLSIRLFEGASSAAPEPFAFISPESTICFCLSLCGDVMLELDGHSNVKLTDRSSLLVFVQGGDALAFHIATEASFLLIELHPNVLFRNISSASSFANRLKGFVREKQPSTFVNLPLSLPAESQSLIADLLHARLSEQTRLMYMKGKVLELLSFYLENLESEEKDSWSASLRIEDRQRMIRVKQILDCRFADQHSLVALAREVGTNDASLKKCFKLLYGKTVFSYLMEVRMITAKNLLKEKKGVAQVAYEVGYKHATHFSSAFKKYFGYLPGQLKMFFLSFSGVSHLGIDMELFYSLTLI